MASMTKAWLDAVKPDRYLKLVSSTGKVYERALHSSQSLAAARDLVGRTLDLSGACRQIAVAASSEWCAVICVWDPGSSSAKYFIQRALPLGA